MTRKKDDTNETNNSNLQPTKLSTRRGGGDAFKIEDWKHSISRDALHPETLGPYFKDRMKKGTEEDHANRLRDNDKVPVVKIGLGPAVFNFKPQHYYNSSSSSKFVDSNTSLNYYRTKYPAIAKMLNNRIPCDSNELAKNLCQSIKQLSLDSPLNEGNEKEAKSKQENLIQDSYRKLVTQKTTYDSGQNIHVLVDDKMKTFKKSSSAIRKAGVRNWKSPETNEDLHNGVIRNLFSWSLPTSTRWKEVAALVDNWNNASKNTQTAVAPEDIANQLNIPIEDFRSLQFHKDLKTIIRVLRNHACHSSLPWLTTMAALTELQTGNVMGATMFSSESQGTFLHSEIIDKHICYLSRHDDASPVDGQRSSFSSKAELFRKQINDTITFGKTIGSSKSKADDASVFSDVISTFNPDWNIIQITALVQSKNRFGMDLYARHQIPQLIVSAMAHLPNESTRSSFTTFCSDPPVYEGSLMRLGLIEEFQKILDRNLIISDDSIVISRKNYWEERGKHNQAMASIIQAMEQEWISTWNFLFPGHTTHRDIQDKILSKIISPSTKKYKLSMTQKLLLYKLTENYKYLYRSSATALATLVSFILKVSEASVYSLCKKIRDIGLEVPLEDRHPTILVIDQDLEIYPWESMRCLLNTDVTRMPSINLIRSNFNFVKSLRPTYPNIVDDSSCTFVLNPDGTLPNVQLRLEKYFVDHSDWVSIIGRPPATTEVQECLENQHIFLYNGHGAGSNFYPDYAIQKLVCQAVPLLMGCASAQAHYAVPRVYGSSTIHSYFLAGCPSVVGYLWEVTDGECDRITVDLVERWLPDKNIVPPDMLSFDRHAVRKKEKCLSTAMRISRKAATQMLTQCAIVCYGLPINTVD